MMKTKKIAACLLACALACLPLSACMNLSPSPQNPPDHPDVPDSPDTPAPPVHTHTFSTEWSMDETHHWHAATCEHTTEVSAKSEHTMSDGECSICGYKPPHVHVDAAWEHDENSHWKTCPACSERYQEDTHTVVDDVCTVCGAEFSSSLLAFELDETTNTYTVTGRGEETGAEIIVPARHLGKAVTKIGNKAFHADAKAPDTTITRVVLPDTIEEIGFNAFTHCTALANVDFGGVKAIGSSAFWDTALTVADLTQVKELGDYAFYACPVLEDVRGAALETIGNSAFYSCSKLQKIALGTALKSVGKNTFYKIAPQMTVNFAGTLSDWLGLNDAVFADSYLMSDTRELYFEGTKCAGNLVLPQGTTRVPQEAFYGIKSLDSLTLPKGVKSYGTDCFYNCCRSETLKVTYEGTMSEYLADAGAAACSYHAADGIELTVGGAKLTGALAIPAGTTEIPARAFYGLSDVTSLSIPSSVTKIGEYTFCCCGITVCDYAGSNSEWNKIVPKGIFNGSGERNGEFYVVTFTCTAPSDSYHRTYHSERSSRRSQRDMYDA